MRTGGWHARAVRLRTAGSGHVGTPYLVDVRHHVGGRAPVRTELGGQGLPLLREHAHVRGVHQHRHDAQPLLLQRVEHHQEPGEGSHRDGHASPTPGQAPRTPTHCCRAPEAPRCRPPAPPA